jgi:HAD superfamily hydrolase (TIGR01490 family)
MGKKRKMAIFDVDGTIFRSSLLIEFTEALIDKNIFKDASRKIYKKAYKNWLDRKGSYEDYISGVVHAFDKNLPGVKFLDFSKIAKSVASFHKDRVYRYTRDVVRDLKKRGYYLLAISNSPKIILDEFCSNLGFNKVYGRIYEVDKQGRFTGKTLFEDLVSDKSKILIRAVEKGNFTFKGSVGVGDTESDIPFLKEVEKPICFNPNKKLFDYARKAGWKIVAERKDVIYHL